GPKWTNQLKPTVTATNPPPVVAVNTNLPATNMVAEVPLPKPVLTSKKFTWEDVESDGYKTYVESLRAVGCPEEKIRTIILADINELFLKKKQKIATETDMKWWTSEYGYSVMVSGGLQEKGQRLEQERRELLTKLLGQSTTQADEFEALQWGSVQLTGPVLGALPPKAHNEVQDICSRSLERQNAYYMDRATQGQPLNPIETAKLREQTRIDLRKVLNPDEVEEFTLRYSHNAHNLRAELRGFDPTPEEFRKIFRGIDPLEHQMALEYGTPEAMSDKQRERYTRQRENAIKEALTPERYHAYLMTKDPLFRQAQMTAMQYNAPSKVVLPIYQMTRLSETKRQKILGDSNLSPQQKNEAINAVNIEHQRSVQQLVTDALSRAQ
ncbi:MAG TPA: hypothetical protein VMZ27_10960, partial [Candidatus Saccharimonadales bacterium]|nr:hypothetical protein [Candidatus Saccharimonadales bacterium]